MNPEKPVDIRETVSALVDGETSDWEVRKALQLSAGDAEVGSGLREDWAAYQTIGAVLRKEPVAGLDISSAVMDAIEGESSPSWLGRMGRTFGQTAIAASVAAIALVGIQQYQAAQNDSSGYTSVAESGIQPETTVVQPPAGFEFQPVTRAVNSSLVEPGLKQGSTVEIPVDRDQLKAHLDELVRGHSEHSVNSTQEVMPMIRVPASPETE